jgi:hypothetical protein
MSEHLELNDIAAIGRTFDEYSRMFGLSSTKLRNTRILDAGGGISSFTAEANDMGLDAKSADRIYKFTPDEIEAKCASDLNKVLSQMPSVRDKYTWNFYKNEDGLRNHREKAYRKFLEDFRAHPKYRYIKTSFPDTIFTNNEFDMTLVSHFLFMYDEHLDYNFHADSMAELIRITKEEIRIFPIVNLRCTRSGFVDKIMKDIKFNKVKFEIKKVDFEFVKGGNEYLSVRL